MLYEYLQKNFAKNEPIFLSNIKIEGISDAALRQQMVRLCKEGKIKKYDRGIYYFPTKVLGILDSTLSRTKVLEKKYLYDENGRCGYFGGLRFANQMGITTQVSAVYEIVTNKATTAYREVCIGGAEVVLRKSNITITSENWEILQLLDLISKIGLYNEFSLSDAKQKIKEYMRKNNISPGTLREFLKYYPERIYKNTYETEVLYDSRE